MDNKELKILNSLLKRLIKTIRVASILQSSTCKPEAINHILEVEKEIGASIKD